MTTTKEHFALCSYFNLLFLLHRADEIKCNVDIAVEILNNLLLYEKFEGGLMSLESNRCPVVPVVNSVAKAFAVQARAR